MKVAPQPGVSSRSFTGGKAQHRVSGACCSGCLLRLLVPLPSPPAGLSSSCMYFGGKKRLETGTVGRAVWQQKYLCHKNHAQLVVWWGDKPVNKMWILLVPHAIHTEEGEFLATSSHMRVLWGFQNLSAEPLDWNLGEKTKLAFRAVEIVNKQRCCKNLFLLGGSQNN